MADLGHAGHETNETIAALVIVIGGAILTAFSLRTRSARSGPTAFHSPAVAPRHAQPAASRSLVLMMVGLSLGAAVIHLAAAPSHDAELGDLGAGFLVSAAFQGWWALRCFAGPSRRVVDLGIVVNLAIVAAWAWTRTVGLPIGEFAGRPEPVGLPDGASVVFELVLVALLAVRRLGIDRALDRRAPIRSMSAVAVVPVLGLVMLLTSLSTVAIIDGLDHGTPTGPASQHVAGH
jgi:hypothetical protein